MVYESVSLLQSFIYCVFFSLSPSNLLPFSILTVRLLVYSLSCSHYFNASGLFCSLYRGCFMCRMYSTCSHNSKWCCFNFYAVTIKMGCKSLMKQFCHERPSKRWGRFYVDTTQELIKWNRLIFFPQNLILVFFLGQFLY